MIRYECDLKSLTPYSQSRQHFCEKKKGEKDNEYDFRIYWEHCHYDPNTRQVYIPPSQFSLALQGAGVLLGDQIPGKGKATYTKYFESGTFCERGILLPYFVPKDAEKEQPTIPYETLSMSSQPTKKDSGRVQRTYPVFAEWSGTTIFVVKDYAADQINQDVFTKHLSYAGQMIGIGRWRPRNKGQNGMFEVIKIRQV